MAMDELSKLAEPVADEELDRDALPCPSCESTRIKAMNGGPGNHWIICLGCGLQTDDGSYGRRIKQWNELPRLAALSQSARPVASEGEGLTSRLRAYRPTNEWGDGVHHVICDEAAAEIERLRGLLIDPGDPAWEDARAVLAAELRKADRDVHAEAVAHGHGVDVPSWMALNLIAHSRRAIATSQHKEAKPPSPQ